MPRIHPNEDGREGKETSVINTKRRIYHEEEFAARKIIEAVNDILDSDDLMDKGMDAFLNATGFWEKYNKAWEDYHRMKRASHEPE